MRSKKLLTKKEKETKEIVRNKKHRESFDVMCKLKICKFCGGTGTVLKAFYEPYCGLIEGKKRVACRECAVS